MTRVHALASLGHYDDHVRPVWQALPASLRGALVTRPEDIPSDDGVVIVASAGDRALVRKRGHAMIMMEHGCGQTFRHTNGELLGHSSYAGAAERYRSGVILLLNPGPSATEAYRQARTRIPMAEVGCPKLDAWHTGERQPVLSDPPIIGASFHWDCRVAPESGSAWARYLPELVAMSRRGWRVLGHAHPRIAGTLRGQWLGAGVPYAETFDQIMTEASLYVVDASSTAYEFASTGRPVVLVNAKHWRRGVRHGLRFWDATSLGGMVDRPEDLERAVRRALLNTPEDQAERARCVAMAYAAVDGRAAERAAQAIVDLLRE
jgi:hypothetical protein